MCLAFLKQISKDKHPKNTGAGQGATFRRDVCSVTQSCPTLWGPMDCRLLGCSVQGIFQAGMLEWVAIVFSRGSSLPRNQTTSLDSPALAGGVFTASAT